MRFLPVVTGYYVHMECLSFFRSSTVSDICRVAYGASQLLCVTVRFLCRRVKKKIKVSSALMTSQVRRCRGAHVAMLDAKN